MNMLLLWIIISTFASSSITVSASCVGDRILQGEVLQTEDFLCAADFRFGLSSNGAVTLDRKVGLEGWENLWSSSHETPGKLVFQNDANLVVYDGSDSPQWASGTVGKPVTQLVLYNSGEVRMIGDDDRDIIWELDVIKPAWHCVSRVLRPDEELLNGEFICEGDQTAGMQDGTLVSHRFLQSSFGGQWGLRFSAKQPATRFSHKVRLQGDGNLVMSSADGKPTWSMRTDGNPGAILEFEDSEAVLKTASDIISLQDPDRVHSGPELLPGQRLYAGQTIYKPFRSFGIDKTGDLAYWDDQNGFDKLWSAQTGAPNPGSDGYDTYLEMKKDGNLVVVANSNDIMWRADYEPIPNAKLEIAGDDEATSLPQIVGPDGTVLWSLPQFNVSEPSCIAQPIRVDQRFEKGEAICDGWLYYGIDYDGRLRREVYHYYGNFYYTWDGNYIDMNGRFADHAVFQSDGNFVVFDAADQPIYSWRTTLQNPDDDPAITIGCYSRVGCSIEIEPPLIGDSGCRGSTMEVDERLYPGQFICSGNLDESESEDSSNLFEFRFGLDSKGILGIWRRGRRVTTISPDSLEDATYANHLIMQGDGNLVLYKGTLGPIWATGTEGNPGAWIGINSSGTVEVHKDDEVLWSMSA